MATTSDSFLRQGTFTVKMMFKSTKLATPCIPGDWLYSDGDGILLSPVKLTYKLTTYAPKACRWMGIVG